MGLFQGDYDIIADAGKKIKRSKVGQSWGKGVRDPAVKLFKKGEDFFSGKSAVAPIPEVGEGPLGGKVGIQNSSVGGQAPAAQQTIDPRSALISSPDQFRNIQTSLAGQLAARARGEGPSLAEMQARQAQQQQQAAFFSQLASTRGNNPLAARTAVMANQQNQAQLARDAMQSRVAEQQKAQELLGGVANQARSADVEQAIKQAQLQNQSAIEQGRLNQAFQELQARYVGMGLDAQKANQFAAIETEKLRQQIRATNIQLAGQATSAAGGLLKGIGTVVGAVYGGPAGAAAGSAVGGAVGGEGSGGGIGQAAPASQPTYSGSSNPYNLEGGQSYYTQNTGGAKRYEQRGDY